jgi:hypothetical protein
MSKLPPRATPRGAAGGGESTLSRNNEKALSGQKRDATSIGELVKKFGHTIEYYLTLL